VEAGVQGTPQLKKLGIGPATRWRLDEAPEGWSFESAPTAAPVAVEAATVDVVLVFITAADQLDPALDRLEHVIFPAGALWIAWPRKAAGRTSDITDSVIREAALRRSLVDTKVAAIDADWSGLKLVWRRSARA
jgi:hypothetical protein